MLLSQCSEQDLNGLEKKAENLNAFIEMRAKNGILLAVGTSIKCFHNLKDKKNKPLFNVTYINRINPESLEMERKAIYDVILDVYSRKNIVQYKTELQPIQEQQENYWEQCHNRWQYSLSILKECPDVLINKI